MRRGTLDPDGLRHVEVAAYRGSVPGGAARVGPGSAELEKMLRRSKAKRDQLAGNADFAALLASMDARKRKEKVEDSYRQVMSRDPALPTAQEIRESTQRNRVAGVFSMRGQPYVPLGGSVRMQIGPKPVQAGTADSASCYSLAEADTAFSAASLAHSNRPSIADSGAGRRGSAISSVSAETRPRPALHTDSKAHRPDADAAQAATSGSQLRRPRVSRPKALLLPPSGQKDSFPRDEIRRGGRRKQRIHIGNLGFAEQLQDPGEIAQNLRLLATCSRKASETPSPGVEAESEHASGIPAVLQNDAERIVAELNDEHSDDEETAAEMGLTAWRGSTSPFHPRNPPGKPPLPSRGSRRMSLTRLQNAVLAHQRVNHVAKLDHKLGALERALKAATESTAKRAHLQARQRLPLRFGRATRGTRIRPTAVLQAQLALRLAAGDKNQGQGDAASPTQPVDYGEIAAEAETRVLKQAIDFREKRANLQCELRFELLRRHLARFHTTGDDHAYMSAARRVEQKVKTHFEGSKSSNPQSPRRGATGRPGDARTEADGLLVDDSIISLSTSMRKKALALSTGAGLELSWKLHQSVDLRSGLKEGGVRMPEASVGSHKANPNSVVCQSVTAIATAPVSGTRARAGGVWGPFAKRLPQRGSVYELALFEAASLAPNPADVSAAMQDFLGHLRRAIGNRTAPLEERELRVVLRAAPPQCVQHSDCKKLINILAALAPPTDVVTHKALLAHNQIGN